MSEVCVSRGPASDVPAATPQFAVLGSVEVTVGSRPLALGGPKPRRLLARLLLADGEAVSVDRLIEDLWSGEAPTMATTSLQAYVSNLRRVLEPGRRPRDQARCLVTRSSGYALVVADTDRDDRHFARLLETAHSELTAGRPQRAARAASAALALWRGPAYADVADESWAAAAGRLEHMRLDAMEVLGLARLAAGTAGAAGAAVPDLESLVRLAPYRERAWALLMGALQCSGQPADALRAFQRARLIFVEELGLEPGRLVRDVEAAVLRGDEQGTRQLLVGDAEGRSEARSTSPAAAAPESAAPESAAPESAASESGTTRPTQRAATADSSTPVSGSRSPLVGRDEEIARFELTLRTAGRYSEPASVLVSGDPGIGKTSLVREVSGRARAAGWQVVWGRCAEEGDAPAFWPLVEALRALPTTEAGTDLLALVRGGGAPDHGGGRGRDGELANRPSVSEALVTAVPALTGSRPTMLVVDDVQWADADTLAALRFLVQYAPAVPLVVVFTRRDGVDGPALDQLMAVLARTRCTRLPLGPLGLDGIAALAASQGAPTDAETVAAVAGRSGGNPFFAAELLRLPAAEIRGSRLPDAVRDVVRRLLATHPAPVRSLLATAAVLGERVDLDLLGATQQVTLDEACDLLDAAVANGMLRAGDDGSFTFSHALVRDAVAAELTMLQRQRVHLRAAVALAVLPGRPLAQRAHHLAAAGPFAAQADVTTAAAQSAAEAARSGGYDEAVRWRRLVMSRLADVPGVSVVERAAVHRELGTALLRAGNPEAGRAEIVTALDLAVSARDTAGTARIAAALAAGGGAWPWIGYEQRPLRLIRSLTRAAELVTGAEPADEAQVLVHLAQASYYTGPSPMRSAELAARAVALVENTPADPETRASVLAAACFAAWNPDTESDVGRLGRRLLDVARECADPMLELLGHHWVLVTDLTLGRQTALPALDASLDLIERSRLPLFSTVGYGYAHAAVLAFSGDVDGALTMVADTAERHRRSGLYLAEDSQLLALVNIALVTDRWDLLDGKLPRDGIAGDSFGVEYRALAAVCAGQTTEAGRILAAAPPENWRYDWRWRNTMVLRAEIVVRAGLVEQAEPVERLLRPHRGEVSNYGLLLQCLAPIDLAIGRLALLRGDAAEAADSLRAAAAIAQGLGAVAWEQRARAGLAEAVRLGGVTAP